MAYHRAYGVDTKIVRIFNTYGPRLRPADGRVVSNFLAQAMRGEPLTVYGDGKQTRSFCYVDDEVARAPRRCSTPTTSGPMNIGNPERVHHARAGRARCSRSPVRPSEIAFEPLPADDPKQRRPDISLAEEVLGWHPTVDLREGLARTHDWYRRHGGTS